MSSDAGGAMLFILPLVPAQSLLQASLSLSAFATDCLKACWLAASFSACGCISTSAGCSAGFSARVKDHISILYTYENLSIH